MPASIYNELNAIIEENLSSVVDVCGKLLEWIESRPEYTQLAYFECFLKEFDIVDLDIEDYDSFLSEIAQENADNGENNVRQLGYNVIRNLVKKNVPESEFYKELWRILHDETLIASEESKVFLFSQFWLDVRTPYFQLENGCTMDNEEFTKTIADMKNQLNKAYYILYAELPEKTQRTSLLMQVADEIPSERARAVFWAVVMDREAFRQMCMRNYRDKKETEE